MVMGVPTVDDGCRLGNRFWWRVSDSSKSLVAVETNWLHVQFIDIDSYKPRDSALGQPLPCRWLPTHRNGAIHWINAVEGANSSPWWWRFFGGGLCRCSTEFMYYSYRTNPMLWEFFRSCPNPNRGIPNKWIRHKSLIHLTSKLKANPGQTPVVPRHILWLERLDHSLN